MEFAGRLQSLTKEEEDEEDEVESDDEGRVSVCLVSFMSNVSVVCVHPLHATALCMLATEHVCMFFVSFLFSFFSFLSNSTIFVSQRPRLSYSRAIPWLINSQ